MEVYEQTIKKTNPWYYALQIGFFAGLVWGGFKMAAYYFEFTKILPGFMVEPFFLHPFLTSISGTFTGWAFFILFSILAALLYTAFFLKAKGPWPGIFYGVAWWVVWFLIIGPLSDMTKGLKALDLNTIITEACLFLLWGLFMGYSINFEFTEERGDA